MDDMGRWAPVCCGNVSALCVVVPPPGLYGVVGTGLLWDSQYAVCCSTSSWTIWVVGTGVLWDVSTLCVVVPPPGLYGVVGTAESSTAAALGTEWKVGVPAVQHLGQKRSRHVEKDNPCCRTSGTARYRGA
jgi:hypothetical protein